MAQSCDRGRDGARERVVGQIHILNVLQLGEDDVWNGSVELVLAEINVDQGIEVRHLLGDSAGDAIV